MDRCIDTGLVLRAALALTVALAGCGGGTEPEERPDPPGPPGVVTYLLSSPNGREGGLLFSVPAASVLEVQQADPLVEVVVHQAGRTAYVALVHRFGTESLSFDLRVIDRSAPPELTLVGVVGPDNRPRSPAGYALGPLP